MFQIIPAINEKTWLEVKKKLDLASMFTSWAHIDVVDGKYAQNVTWNNSVDLDLFEKEMNPPTPKEGSLRQKGVREASSKTSEKASPAWMGGGMNLELHLMINEPEKKMSMFMFIITSKLSCKLCFNLKSIFVLHSFPPSHVTDPSLLLTHIFLQNTVLF